LLLYEERREFCGDASELEARLLFLAEGPSAYGSGDVSQELVVIPLAFHWLLELALGDVVSLALLSPLN
jgi:hypothetical protein